MREYKGMPDENGFYITIQEDYINVCEVEDGKAFFCNFEGPFTKGVCACTIFYGPLPSIDQLKELHELKCKCHKKVLVGTHDCRRNEVDPTLGWPNGCQGTIVLPKDYTYETD